MNGLDQTMVCLVNLSHATDPRNLSIAAEEDGEAGAGLSHSQAG